MALWEVIEEAGFYDIDSKFSPKKQNTEFVY